MKNIKWHIDTTVEETWKHSKDKKKMLLKDRKIKKGETELISSKLKIKES